MDDVAVDLDDRWPQGGDEREAGISGARIVDREAEAELAQGPDLALERGDVGDRLLLGALDGDLARVEADLADLGGQRGRLEGAIDEAERRQVDGVAALRQARLASGRLEPPDP